jgi:hypothetical protein
VEGGATIPTRVIHLSKFIEKEIGRKLDNASPPSVLMKMDIEGEEYKVLKDLIK